MLRQSHVEAVPSERMIFLCLIYIACSNLLLSYNFFREEMTRNEQRDSDVFVEQVLVLNKTNDPEQTPVVVSGLTKYYGAFKAVDGLYLQIDKSECFGLLGMFNFL